METGGKAYIIYPSRSSEIEIWNFSDLHMMNASCAEDILRADIAEVMGNPNAFWFGGGDYVDYISHTDRRFNPREIDESVSIRELGELGWAGAKRVKALFQPIRSKCLGLLFGNHEYQYAVAKDQLHLHSWLCEELRVKNLGYCAIFDVLFVRRSSRKAPYLTYTREGLRETWRVRMFAHHGAGFATTPGGKLNRLLQFMDSFRADVYWCGHVHDQKGQRIPSIGTDDKCEKIIAFERLGMISGGYLKTYEQGVTGYGEIQGYRPTQLGSAKVVFTPDKRTFKGEI